MAEVAQLRSAMFFGLGPEVWVVLDHLVEEGAVPADRVVMGVLHGSPENTYRATWLTGARTTPVPWRTNPAPYDAGRRAFRQRFLGRAD